jgi:hypothetical protein
MPLLSPPVADVWSFLDDVVDLVSEVFGHVLGLDAEPQMSSHLWVESLHDPVEDRDFPLLLLLQCLGVRNECGL